MNNNQEQSNQPAAPSVTGDVFWSNEQGNTRGESHD